MKRIIIGNEHLLAWEAGIRKDEREKLLAEFSKSQRECYEFASKIMERTAAFKPPQSMDGDDPLPDKPVPKRKATTADQGQIDEALTILRNVRPPFTALTATQVSQAMVLCGKKTAGHALRALVTQGFAVEVKRGKFTVAEAVKMGRGNTGDVDNSALTASEAK